MYSSGMHFDNFFDYSVFWKLDVNENAIKGRPKVKQY